MPAFGAPGADVKYREYQVPGGQNYREDLIKAPKFKAPSDAPDDSELLVLKDQLWERIDDARDRYNLLDYEDGSRADQFWQNTIDPLHRELDALEKEILAIRAQRPKNYETSHWPDDPNVLVHSRANDRFLEGAESKGRFIEEIQSDLHQQGHVSGYSQEEHQQLVEQFKKKLESLGPVSSDEMDSPRIRRLQAQEERLEQGPVPNLPFKESYPDLALKQQLLDAAEDPSIDWLGISGPETQINRFPSEKNVKGMQFNYGEKYPAALKKLLKPFGGEVESVNLPFQGKFEEGLEPYIGYNKGTFYRGAPQGEGGTAVASAYPKPNPALQGHFASDLQPVEAILRDQAKQGINPPGPQAWISRLTPEMKQKIKEVGFPAMAALFGLRDAFSGREQ
jgi:hypothetical protein